MKHYLLPQKKHYYKANMHMHTKLSDGQMSPEEAKEAFKAHGYSIVAFTDHEGIVAHPELRDEDFLPITACEIAIGESANGMVPNSNPTYHLNLFAKDPDNTVSSVFCEERIWKRIEHIKEHLNREQFRYHYPREYTVECINGIIAQARKDGFLVSYNHPVWSLQDYTDYAELKGLWGVEVHNTACVRMGHVDTVQPFDDLLHQGEAVVPLATDDAHKLSECFGGWIMVGADCLEYTDVMQALENGDLYASEGPEIHEISIEGGKLHISCSEAVSIAIASERRFYKKMNADGGALLTEADFDLTEYLEQTRNYPTRRMPYIRVTVIDAAGKSAWSRAYRADELDQ